MATLFRPLQSARTPAPKARKCLPLRVEPLEAREVPAGWAAYASSYGTVSAPERVKAGQTVVVEVNARNSPADVSMSGADPNDVLVDGVKASATSGHAGLYDYGGWGMAQPVPLDGAKVHVAKGEHTVRFHIKETAPDAAVVITGTPGVPYGAVATGPFVVLGSGSWWSTPVGFEIDGNLRESINLTVTATSPHGAVAWPGDVVTYNLSARAPLTDLVEFKLETAVPYGTTLVPGSVTGFRPSVDGGHIVWKKTKADPWSNTFGVSFRAKVNAEEDLGSLRALRLSATATKVGKETGTETRSADHEMKLVRATQISGTVKDLKLAFPQTIHIKEVPLADATVRLWQKGVGRILDVATTDASGKYEVQAPHPGTYVVEVSALANRYQQGTKLNGTATVFQRFEVVIEKDRAEPFRADDVFVPVQVLNRTAELMKKLHDVRPQILGGWVNVLAEGMFPDFMNFGYDVTAVSGLVTRVFDRSKEETFRVYDGTGARDTLNGLIRVNAFMETLSLRLDQVLKDADSFGKAVALFISTNLIPALGAMRKQPKLTDVEQVVKFTALDFKIATMTMMGPALKFLFDKVHAPPRARDMISTFVFNVARYAFDRYTGQAADDLLFEFIFTTVRTGLGAGYVKAAVSGAFGVRGTQQVLDEAAWMADRKGYAGDTNATLAYLDRLWGKVDDRVKFAQGIVGDAQWYLNITRLVTGLRDVYVGGSEATGTPVKPGDVGLIGRILDKMNEKVWPLLPEQKGSATPAMWFQQAFKGTMIYLLPMYVLPIGLPILELYSVDPMMEAIGRGSMSGPIDADIDPPPSTSWQAVYDALFTWKAEYNLTPVLIL